MTKSFNHYAKLIAGASLALLSLSGCSDFRQAIGSEKSVPDEFEVVVRPPLSLPPGFSARPGDVSAGDVTGGDETVVRTASISARDQTIALLGVSDGTAQGYDDLFAFDAVPENIRALVDQETAGIRFERRLPFQIVFGGLPDVGPVLDQMQEDVRLRANKLQGRVPTDGATIGVDGVEGTKIPLE